MADPLGRRGPAITAALRDRRVRAAVLILAVVLVALVVLVSQNPTGQTSIGHRARVFGPAPISPTAREGQSRLWFSDGRWWGVLYERTSGTFRIAQLDRAQREWIDSGTEVDERDSAQSDVLWDGRHLHVVSAGRDPKEPRHGARALRFSYDSATSRFRLDRGYPVDISERGARAISIARDGTGTVWAAFTEDRAVKIAHSLGDSPEWTEPYRLPVADASDLLAQDQAAIVAFDGGVGVMWSNQVPAVSAFGFAVHRDGEPDDVWRASVAERARKGIDNHISLVGLPGDPAAEVLALVKTSLTQSDAPLYRLLALRSGGTWARHTVWRVADDVSRARLAVDAARRRIYVYSATPCCSGGEIRLKETDLDRISFPPGRGRPLIAGPGVRANNPTSTKQLISAESGLVVLAADASETRYLYSTLDDIPPPGTTGTVRS